MTTTHAKPGYARTFASTSRAAIGGLLAALCTAGGVAAQEDDAAWLERCRDRDNRENRAVFCDVRLERVPARGALRVDAAPNGGITVRAAQRTDIEIHARIRASAANDAAARSMAGGIRTHTGGETIRAEGPETGDREHWSVSWVIYVPARTDLALETHNGPVSVQGVRGRIEGRTHNGPLALRDVAGDVVARTQNGPLTVELTGTRFDGSGLDAETQNGPVSLTLPDGYSAQLETGTRNGPFSTEIPLTITRLDGHSRRLETTLGGGGPRVRVVTTNGPASIRRR